MIEDEDIRGVAVATLVRKYKKEDLVFYAQQLLAEKDARRAADAKTGTAEEWKEKAAEALRQRDYYKKQLDHFVDRVMELEAKIEKMEADAAAACCGAVKEKRAPGAGRKPKYTAADARSCAALRAEGKTLREIVKLTGIGLGTVSKLLKQCHSK